MRRIFVRIVIFSIFLRTTMMMMMMVVVAMFLASWLTFLFVRTIERVSNDTHSRHIILAIELRLLLRQLLLIQRGREHRWHPISGRYRVPACGTELST